MFTRYCDTCEKPQKCHNEDGNLYCIGCKFKIGEAPTA